MTSSHIAHQLHLPFLTDLYQDIKTKYPVVNALVPNDIPYDSKSSFSLYINHRNTFTGITDIDRSMTMNKFAELIQKIPANDGAQAMAMFGKEFRSPGHIPICVAAPNLLNERKGHTELVIALLEMAGLAPAGSGCEIMGDNGKALSKQDVQTYAKKHGFTFLEGKDIVEAWKQWSR